MILQRDVDFRVSALQVSPGGEQLAVGGASGELGIIELSSGDLKSWGKVLPDRANRLEAIQVIAWHPDEDRLACSNKYGEIAVVNLHNDSMDTLVLEEQGNGQSLSWNPTKP